MPALAGGRGHAETVEGALARQIRPLMDHDLTIVFHDLSVFDMNKKAVGFARHFVLGVVQTAKGLPLTHTVHLGNVAERKMLQTMLKAMLQRFPVQRILVADRAAGGGSRS